MDASYLALYHQLSQQFRLKFDGTQLIAVHRVTGVRLEVTTSLADVVACAGCTKLALLQALSQRLGLLARPLPARVPWAEALVRDLGLPTAPVYVTQCHAARVTYLLPGMAAAVAYVVVTLAHHRLLVMQAGSPDAWAWLAVNHFLATTPYAGQNQAIKAYQAHLATLSKDAQLPYQLDPTTATRLGIPSVGGVWLIS